MLSPVLPRGQGGKDFGPKLPARRSRGILGKSLTAPFSFFGQKGTPTGPTTSQCPAGLSTWICWAHSRV